MFEAILIDFYGTVSAGDREAVEAVCKRIVETCDLPLPPKAFAITWGERFFDVIAESNHDGFRTLFECELSSLRATLADLDIDLDPLPFIRELEEYWANPPLYADAIEFLRDVSIPTCCVSNADTEPLQAAISRHGLHFDAMITSEESRCYKPDPRIFELALQRIGCPADRVLHVGDSLHSDVSGAASTGISTVWLKRNSRIHDIGVDKPNYTINSMDELGPIVRR